MIIIIPANNVKVMELLIGSIIKISPQAIDNIARIRDNSQGAFSIFFKPIANLILKILARIKYVPKITGIMIVSILG